jgi:ABC-2 type transport system ATP-binding protein
LRSVALDGLRHHEDPIAYTPRIGYVPEEPYLHTHLTAVEYLTLVGRLRGLSQARRSGRWEAAEEVAV